MNQNLNNLSEMKVGAYKINLDEYQSIGSHRPTLHVNAENVTHFDCFCIEHILKEIKKFI